MSNIPLGPAFVAPKHIRLTLLGLMLGLLLSMLDNFIVGTALPTIVGELGGVALFSWVVTAYALTTAVTTPIWGKLGDLFGRKMMFQLAVSAFTLGSVFAALSPTMELLIASRAFQGIGAGGIAVGAFAVIGDLVPPRERGKYQGMVAIVVAAGTIGGPLVGGFVTDGLGWRWAFLINLPLGIITLVWVALMLKIPVARRRARIDWAGAGYLAVAISSIVLLTTWAGAEFPWLSIQAFGLIALALVALAAFIWQERRSPEPILPLGIFANRSFTMASILAFITGAVVFACVLYLPLFQQSVQGASASASGLLLLPMMIPVVIVSQIAGRTMTATGRYKIFPVIGAIALTVGGILLATMTASTPAFITAIFMVFMGIGSGLTQQMTTTIAQNSVEQKDIGAASGAVTLLRTVGGSIGVAIFGTIYATSTQGFTGPALHEGVAQATSSIFIIVAIVSALAVLAACYIKEVPLRTRAVAPAAPGAASTPGQRPGNQPA